MFSSISAEVGDFGAGSYAAGNRFMDSYMVRRGHLFQAGKRHGKSLAINWPYWQAGGLKLPEEDKVAYSNYSGVTNLNEEKGLEIFNRLLSLPYSQVFVVEGDRRKIERVLGLQRVEIVSPEEEEVLSLSGSGEEDPAIYQAMETYLKGVFSKIKPNAGQ